jgi:hypothetical protein
VITRIAIVTTGIAIVTTRIAMVIGAPGGSA